MVDALQQKTATGGVPAVAVEDTFDDLVENEGVGTESIGIDDVRPPRLMLCQSGSPQRKPDNPKQIPGLQELDLFNSLSGEIYGRSVRVVVVRTLGDHWVEFNDDLTVADPNVPEGDPRTEWTNDEEGNRVKPVATQFYDYLLWLIDHNEIVTFSFKSTQITNAIKLNGLLKLPLKVGAKVIMNPPAWARVYKLDSKMENKNNYAYGGYNLSTDGITPPDVRAMVQGLHATYAKLNADEVVRREDDAADNTVDEAAAATSNGEREPGSDDGDEPGM
jgi:hypothetical protein